MSPQRTSAGGSFRLAWQRREIGRIAVSSGARTLAGWRAAMALCDRLYERNELDLLRAIQAGQVTVKEVLAAEKAKAFGRGDALHILTLRRPLMPAVRAWLAAAPPTKRWTYGRYETSWNKLEKVAGLAPSATVADLKAVDWPSLRGKFDSASDWNHMRRAVSRFLTATLGDTYHPVRREIVRAIDVEPEAPRMVELSAAEFWKLVQAAAEPARAAIVTLAVTGMRLGEYERLTRDQLKPATFAVQVPGTKTARSLGTVHVGESLWPWVEAGVPMPLRRIWFRKLFKRAAEAIGRKELRLHDLRHLTTAFALEGGAPVNAVRDLMRHERAEQTMDYGRAGNSRLAAQAIEKVLSVGALHSSSHTKRRAKRRAGGTSA
jgi:integrase